MFGFRLNPDCQESPESLQYRSSFELIYLVNDPPWS